MARNNDLETARTILHNAVQMNMSQELILKISQKLDEYINVYYWNETVNNQKKPNLIKEAAGVNFASSMYACRALHFSYGQRKRSRAL